MSKHILVVDDDQPIREFLVLFLTDEGYEVAQATNGLEALEQIERQSPSLVITDIRMPAMDGVELLTRLLEQGEQMPPAMAMAASALKLGEARQLIGEVNCFAKPFEPDDVLFRIQQLIGAP